MARTKSGADKSTAGKAVRDGDQAVKAITRIANKGRIPAKATLKTRAAGALIVPNAGPALSKAIEAARLSPESLRQFAGPAPDRIHFRAEKSVRLEVSIPPLVRLRKAFNAKRFASLLGSKLAAQQVGFACQVNELGGCRATAQHGWARNPSDGKVRWDTRTRMHIASASKFYTAVALGRLLHQRGISFDARIKDFLPVHWAVGSKAYFLSFGALLSHQAGLWTAACEYAEVKKDVAQASNGIGEGWHYANGNYALMRILLPIIDGTLDRRIDYGRVLLPTLRNQTDMAWDILTRKHFHDYMHTHIWRPAGISFASLRSSTALWNFPPFSGFPQITNAAIGYGYPPVADSAAGADVSVDLTACGGAVGWHVSCEEMLAAASRIRRSGQVLPKAALKEMFDKGYGIFGTHGNDHARMQYHDGIWNGSEWSYLGFVGSRYEVAVLTNNARDMAGQPSLGLLRDIVHAAFDESFA